MRDLADMVERFRTRAGMSAEDGAVLLAGSRSCRVASGSVVFGPDKPHDDYVFILTGRMRVRALSNSGGEITLFRLIGGDSTLMATAGLLSQARFVAEGVAETDLCTVKISRETFDRLLDTSPGFRAYVMASYRKRMLQLMMLVEEVSFEGLDKRLVQRLFDLAGDDNVVKITHQELACDLGKAREVVSRALKGFERRGWLTCRRGRVELRDRPALAQMLRKVA